MSLIQHDSIMLQLITWLKNVLSNSYLRLSVVLRKVVNSLLNFNENLFRNNKSELRPLTDPFTNHCRMRYCRSTAKNHEGAKVSRKIQLKCRTNEFALSGGVRKSKLMKLPIGGFGSDRRYHLKKMGKIETIWFCKCEVIF